MAKVEYRKNAGAVFFLKYHFVWCPKYRKSILGGDLKNRLIQLLEEKCQELDIIIEAFEVMPDHIHLFLNCPTTLSPAQIAFNLKGYTSKTLREEFEWLKRRMSSLWSESYYCGTVGHVSELTVKAYIENQKTEYDYKKSKKNKEADPL